MQIGFIGLGRMGAPMARRLGEAGFALAAYDKNAGACAAMADAPGVSITPSAQDAVAGAEIVITMLPDGAAVAAAMAEAPPDPGAILVDMSTAAPAEAAPLKAALPEGVDMVDAPVSGGVARAIAGTLTIMAGGPEGAVTRAAPIFSPMGEMRRVGELGAGRAMKLLNNYLSAAGLAAACEAVAIGRAFGLDPDLMADIFNGSTGKNNATEVKLKQHVNSGAFASGFAMGLMAKDLRLGVDLAAELKVKAEGVAAMRDLYNLGEELYGVSADHTEIARVLIPKTR